MITILFGIKNKQDDENQEQVDDRSEDGQKPSPSEQEEIEEAAPIPFRDSRPQTDKEISEVDRTFDPETPLPTSRPWSVPGRVQGEGCGVVQVPIHRYFSIAGS